MECDSNGPIPLGVYKLQRLRRVTKHRHDSLRFQLDLSTGHALSRLSTQTDHAEMGKVKSFRTCIKGTKIVRDQTARAKLK